MRTFTRDFKVSAHNGGISQINFEITEITEINETSEGSTLQSIL